MADFSTIAKELLSRILRLEAQVSICIQNQEVLFLQASNCQLAQECLKLAEDFGDEQFSKGIGHTHTGTTNGKKCQSPCPIQASTTRNVQTSSNSSPPVRPEDDTVTSPSPILAQILNNHTQGMELPDEVRGPNEISEFLRQIEIIGREPTSSASAADGPALSTTERRRQLQRHQREQVDHGCQKCGLGFSTAGYLLRHVRKVHSVRAPQLTCANRFQCEFCSASYGKRNSLRIHQNRAHGHFSKGVRIMDMGMEGDGSSGGTNTATREPGYQPFVCQICGKSYRNQGVLDYHIYMHTRGGGSELNEPGRSSDLDPDMDILANLSLVWGSEEVTRTTRTAHSIGENQN